MDTTTTDAIRKDIVLKAPRERVWKAISEPAEFGAWFGVDMTGVTFTAGRPAVGKMTYPGYEDIPSRSSSTASRHRGCSRSAGPRTASTATTTTRRSR